MDSSYDLQRFLDAQEPVIEDVFQELRRGRKQRHWMWFVFPQLRGLGSSAMAEKFGISSREEAAAYLAHPILGARLLECTLLVTAVQGRSITEILGYPDDLKFRSSMTLFARVAENGGVFNHALAKYFGGAADEVTLKLLGEKSAAVVR